MRGTPTENFAAAYFSAQSPDLQSILKGAADGVDLNVEVKPVNSFRRFGDCASFHERQIPTIHIYSGFHADYHKPGDTADKIDYAKLTKMIDLADRAIRNLVEAPTGPRFDPSIKAPAGAAPY